MNEILSQIAKKHLSIETLETRHLDCLDFHDVAVWKVKNALEKAYMAGRNELFAELREYANKLRERDDV